MEDMQSGGLGNTGPADAVTVSALLQKLDDINCPLGPHAGWPVELRNAVGLILPAKAEIVLFWGPDYIALYNDAYAPTIGAKHPRALGRPAIENWRELWDDLEPLLRGVRETGETFHAKDRPFYIERQAGGAGEEVFFDVSYSPVPGQDDQAGGVLCIVSETTPRVRAEAALREERNALGILNASAARIAGEIDIDRMVQKVVDSGVELSGAQFGAFFYNLLDDAGESFTLYALSGARRSDFDRFPMPRNTEIFGPTFRGEGPVRSGDITRDPRYGKSGPHHGMPPGHLTVRSYLAAPVTLRSGEVVGGLLFGHPEADVFDARAERLIVGLASHAAISVDTARLFQALQAANQSLEGQVAARTAERDRIWQVSQDLLMVADPAGAVRSVNPAWERVLGWRSEDLVGRATAWLEHPDDRERTRAEIAALAAGGSTNGFENRFRGQNGEYRTLSWNATAADGVLFCVARDVTAERRRQAELHETQERLRQAQKMETVGQLTGGVAHDFNNLLQVVIGNLETIARGLPEGSTRLRRAADHAMTGARRAATLTQRLLAFARRQPLSPQAISPNRLVSGMSEMLHRTLGETIEVETVLSSSLWRIEVDVNGLENAILNLALNARDAMPDGGKLTIETANTHLDHDYARRNAEVTAGQYVMISVSDTGEGMDGETLQKVFEPFFTTKEVGKGTGLGLSMIYGFVKQSCGHVKIYSEPAQGTTVRIYLPRLLGEAPNEDEAEPPPPPEGSHEETILVCEDDDDVRAYSVETLRDLGYRVLEAHDGASALRLLERQDGKVDLLFTDVVLPGGMTGAVVAEAARGLRPDLKVLFTTGYARNAIVHHGRLDAGVQLITKPFTHSDLAARIRDILDSR